MTFWDFPRKDFKGLIASSFTLRRKLLHSKVQRGRMERGGPKDERSCEKRNQMEEH